MKSVIINPGWSQSSDNERFDFVANAYRDKGYRALRYSPSWDGRTMNDWVDGPIRLIDQIEDEVALWGFSLGAMASLIISAQRPVTSLILCSPSGYFREHLPLIDNKYLKVWNRRQLDAFESFSIYDTVERMQSKDNYVLAGQVEVERWPEIHKVVDDLKATDKFNVNLIKDVNGDDFSTPNYQQAILEAIGSLK
jgi:pimeloyl-ACP methyl ester carboxylesterase